jgi:hypothetical protein
MELGETTTRVYDLERAIEFPFDYKDEVYGMPKISIVRPYTKTDGIDIMRFVKMASETLEAHLHGTPSTYATIKSPTPQQYHDELVLYIEVQNADGTISLVDSEPVSPRY